MPLMAWITTVYNWQFAIVPGLTGGIICGVLFLLFGKDWPSQLQLPAYGDDEIYYPPNIHTDNAVTISVKALFGRHQSPSLLGFNGYLLHLWINKYRHCWPTFYSHSVLIIMSEL
jgi:hypothetical protein